MGQDKHERITVHSERIVIIARCHATRRWCERCGHEVETLTAEAVRLLLEIVPNGLERVNHRKLHLRRVADGLIACLKSPLTFLEAAGTHGGSYHVIVRRFKDK